MITVDSTGPSRPATKQPGEQANDEENAAERRHKKRAPRDPGDALARRRFENIRKHSARTRHRTGIVNNGEKNRLTIAEKQMLKNHRASEARIMRLKEQLKRELHEMEAGRRALRRHSICVKDENRDKDRHSLSKYAQRGRYMYAIRNETKSQKEDMESYNERLEKAKKMLQPALKQSNLAMDNGKLLGRAPSNAYLSVGRRISVVEAPPAAKLLMFADSDDEDENDIMEVMKEIPVKINIDRKTMAAAARAKSCAKTPPPFDLNQLRKEFSPELRKALEGLMIDDPNVMLAMPVSRENTRGSRRDSIGQGLVEHMPDIVNPDVTSAPPEPQTGNEKQSSVLKLPPVQVEKALVGRTQKGHKAAASKPVLSTVAET
ncbi:uncharacterized protein [Diadema setosum]|uniref:uncharacterized protein n=1 Tax=Diadema setosum TaxID=31175 RepID=UPI003B3B1C4F